MIHIGEHTLEQVIIEHQRWTRNQCMCGLDLTGMSLAEHLVQAITAAQQD